MTKQPEPLLLLTDARGIYIPRDFTYHVSFEHVANVTDEDWSILEAGPEHEHYWDTWDDVLDNAEVTSDEGVKYFLNQEGDLWLIPKGMEWSEEADGWRWPEKEQDDNDRSESEVHEAGPRPHEEDESRDA